MRVGWTSLVVVLVGLAGGLGSAGEASAQEGAAAEGAPPPAAVFDEALRAALTESGASFQDLPSGDFLVRFRQNPEDTAGMPVVVRSRRIMLVGQEVRNIFVVLARGTGDIKASVVNQLVLTNGQLPAGSWGVERLPDGRFLVLFKVHVPAEASGDRVYGMARYVAQVAFRQRAMIGQLIRAENAATQPATSPATQPSTQPSTGLEAGE